jgi:hypothetical protein
MANVTTIRAACKEPLWKPAFVRPNGGKLNGRPEPSGGEGLSCGTMRTDQNNRETQARARRGLDKSTRIRRGRCLIGGEH